MFQASTTRDGISYVGHMRHTSHMAGACKSFAYNMSHAPGTYKSFAYNTALMNFTCM